MKATTELTMHHHIKFGIEKILNCIHVLCVHSLTINITKEQ